MRNLTVAQFVEMVRGCDGCQCFVVSFRKSIKHGVSHGQLVFVNSYNGLHETPMAFRLSPRRFKKAKYRTRHWSLEYRDSMRSF